MIALALRSMGERKLRAVLTAIAVLLGVAMISGTYVQTDRIRTAFEGITETANAGVDAVVTRPETFMSDFSEPDLMDDSVVAAARSAAGVEHAEGQLADIGTLVVDGEAIGSGMAPTLVLSSLDERFSGLRVLEGTQPRAEGDVVILRKLADDEDLAVGDRAGLSTRTGEHPVRIVGIAEFGHAQSLGGATIVVPRLEDLQRWYGVPRQVSSVVVAAVEGTSPEQVVAALRTRLPRGFDIETGEKNAQDSADEINDSIGAFLTPALLALSGAALLVGAFIIFNTFSITVAQRTREFGLLRAMGATRRQLMAAVGVEALILGVGASILGLVAGLGIAAGLGWLFDAAGFGIPTGGLELAPRTIVVALAVGIGVTLLAALAPARRATRVPPVAALSAGAAPVAPRHRRLAPLAAGATGVIGLLLLLEGLFGGGPAVGRLGSLAGGAVLLFVGVALLARHVVRPLAGAIGWPLQRAFDEPGRLARENAMRNPARTATTSAALMVGLGLVVFVAVFAAGLKASFGDSLGELVRAEVIVTGKGFQPLPAGAGQVIVGVDGVRATSPQYVDAVQVEGRPVDSLTDMLNGVDPLAIGGVYEPELVDGTPRSALSRLGEDRVLVEEQFADKHGIATGERFEVRGSSGQGATLVAVGEYRDPQLLQGVIIDQATFRRLSPARDPYSFLVAADAGVGAEALKARVDAALGRYPTAEVRTNADYRALMEDQIDQLVYLLYALLAMSLVISLFGIANSLFLSIHERVREFGLLRAVGATQAQVRRVVRYESVITAVIGGLLGTVVGVAFAALATAALSNLGLSFALPAGQLAVFLVLAVAVGVLGAVMPARRAARVDVLQAMHQE